MFTEDYPRPKPPDVDGYLGKLKHKQSIFGAWTRRYFHVNSELERLEYFKSKQHRDDGVPPSGFIDLNELSHVRRFDGNAFQIEAGQNVFFLRADSAAEQACWIIGLETYLQEHQDFDRWMSARKAFKTASKG